MGTVLGAATMLSSIGMSLGPLVGGWIFDTFGSYSWMFFGSFALGLGAMAIAFTFPRPAAAATAACEVGRDPSRHSLGDCAPWIALRVVQRFLLGSINECLAVLVGDEVLRGQVVGRASHPPLIPDVRRIACQ